MGLGIHVAVCYVFVLLLKLDILGLGLANVLTQLCVYSLLLVYTRMQEDLQEAFVPFTLSEASNELGPYIKLAIPSTIMLVLDWWVWEFMILISGYLGVNE